MNHLSFAPTTQRSALARVNLPPRLFFLFRTLAIVVFVAPFAFLFLPWVQTSQGTGTVIAYNANERPLSIEAPIKGRIQSWKVLEGERVEKGQPLAVIEDNDPQLIKRLEEKRDAYVSQVTASERSVEASERRLGTIRDAQKLALDSADAKISMAQNKVRSAQNVVSAALASSRTADMNYTRQKPLADEGIISARKMELVELKRAEAKAKLFKAQADKDAARADLLQYKADREFKQADFEGKIEKARAEIEKARSDLSKAKASLVDVEVKLARQRSMTVFAPQSGVVLKIYTPQGGPMLKAGSALAQLVPTTNERAIEIWIDGNDAPLVTPGAEARVQFEGWPALQFSGWPSAAIGTFGAKVAFVDSAGTSQGKFRVVLVPQDDAEWPDSLYLRQGVRANAWLLLNEVTVGYELWRQINGFPITAGTAPSGYDQDKGGKLPKDTKKKNKK